jgi:hypothetical protein
MGRLILGRIGVVTLADGSEELVGEGGRLGWDFDFAVDGLEAGEVGGEGLQEELGISGGHDDAGLDAGAGVVRKHLDEIEDDLAVGLADDSRVGVDGGEGSREFQLDAALVGGLLRLLGRGHGCSSG